MTCLIVFLLTKSIDNKLQFWTVKILETLPYHGQPCKGVRDDVFQRFLDFRDCRLLFLVTLHE